MSDQPSKDTRLTLVRKFPVSREKVFAAWTDSKQLAQWHAPMEGFSIPRVEVDLRVGGSYQIAMVDPEGTTHTVKGKYLEVSPPEKLVYTWAFEGSPMEQKASQVTLLFEESGDQTTLTLTHELFPDTESTQKHQEGWAGCLSQLEKFLAA